jgi:hypothetical protein
LGYFQHARGTIRLIEVGIYGLEGKEKLDAIAAAEELELSQLLTETKPDESDEQVSILENVPFDDLQMNHKAKALVSETNHKSKALVNEVNTVESTIRSYERAYQNKDLANLMSTISSDYFRDGETYQQLESKMQNLFYSYDNIDFTLRGLNIEQMVQDAKVESNYSLKLEVSGDKTSSYSGKLFFKLSNTNGVWKINQISTKRW